MRLRAFALPRRRGCQHHIMEASSLYAVGHDSQAKPPQGFINLPLPYSQILTPGVPF